MTIAIVGAGMAGLSAAEVLTGRGENVRLFDKGRGAGGRMATRRTSLFGTDITFDHGAQYFTARSEGFRAAVTGWLNAGVAAPWNEDNAPASAPHRYVGAPGMNSILKAMAAPLDVSWGAEVKSLEGGPSDWRLRFADGSAAGSFKTVIVAVPAEQAAVLLADAVPALAASARKADRKAARVFMQPPSCAGLRRWRHRETRYAGAPTPPHPLRGSPAPRPDRGGAAR